MTIHSFRRVLRIRRSIHAVQWSPGRSFVLPFPVPLNGVMYFAALELAFLALSRLPVVGALAHLPMKLYWIAPLWIVYLALTMKFDGRDPHRWLLTYVQYRLRPRVTLARRKVQTRRTVGGKVRAYYDEHSPRLHRGRVHGPARVRFRVPVSFSLGVVARSAFIARADPRGKPHDYDVDDRLEVKP